MNYALCKKFSFVVAISAFIGLGACASVQAQDTEGGLPGDSGVLCQAAGFNGYQDIFAYIKKEDGSIDFSYGMLGEDAACGVNGNARANSLGWTFRDESCTLTIRIVDDAIRLSTGDDDCRNYCGFRAHMEGRSIPLSSVAKESITPQELDSGALYNIPCR